ncbi:MAG: catalase family protein [Sphingomonas sp.]|uniref:catalase family protein n=1 Tax=Sphingomonas sp. TaxID=28214 RepID=UPI001AD1531E|nr:catalase family protein [Sphingomonas sp.]MBN8809248.1 catalase family protein [Sphingomonas sp.]
MPAPVRFTPHVEQVQPDEAETIRELNETFDVILKKTAEDYGHAVRSVHAKAHGILRGELTIDGDLPPDLAQGLFATPGTHPAFLRLSTNAGDILPDAISLPRGFALKVLDVAGERLPGSDGTTQDFIMVNAPAFQAKTAAKFLGNLKLLAKTTDRIEGTKKVLSAALRGVHNAIEAVGLQPPATIDTLGGAPNVEPLGETYYSVTPFRYGDYIAKFRLRPVAPAMTALSGEIIDVAGREDAIREEVQTEMRDIDAEWEFGVQLAYDLDEQPIEDSTVPWDEEKFPFRRVGTLRARHQDSWAPALVKQVQDEMRFSIWTGLAAHQPLGNINRARNEPYRRSADFRARFNHCPYHEPVVESV